MPCLVCESLHREHSRACEEEAKAILEQYKPLFHDCPAPASAPDQNLDDVILVSRKRQLKLASELNEHVALAHAAVA